MMIFLHTQPTGIKAQQMQNETPSGEIVRYSSTNANRHESMPYLLRMLVKLILLKPVMRDCLVLIA